MPRMRPELVKGLAVLGIFLALIVTSDLLFPYSVAQDGYTVVDIRRVVENPQPLEGLPISSTATVISVTDQGSYHSVGVSEGVTLVIPSTINSPEVGQRILLRGTSWLYSNGSIQVREFYALDSSSSLIRSIPGILLFIVIFFMTFKIDFRRLTFIPRKEERESA